jgi:hypothetical protein
VTEVDKDWNVSTLKEYIDVRFGAVQEAINKAEAGVQQRATKLEVETTARFATVNEFRGQQKDLQAGFMPRAEFDAAFRGLTGKVDSLEKGMNERIVSLEKTLTERINAKNLQVVLSMSAGAIAILIAVFNFASAHAG